MTILIAALVIWCVAWFFISFRYLVVLTLCPALAYVCFTNGYDFITTDLVSVRVYGWMAMAAGVWMVLCTLVVVRWIVEDIWYEFFPKKAYWKSGRPCS